MVNFLKKFFGNVNITTVMIAAAVVFCMLWLQQCNRARQLKSDLSLEKQKSDQNVAAMTEQINVVKKLSGDIESSKASYIGSLADIRKYDSALYLKFKDQQNLLAGIYSDFSVKLDSLISKGDTQHQYNDSTYGIRFNAQYNDTNLYNNITGETKFGLSKGKVSPMYTTIFSNDMRINMSYCFRELKDRNEVFAISRSDKIKFNELNGVFTLKKTSAEPVKNLKWILGPQLGITYSLTKKAFMPYVGIGISYKVITF